MKAVALLVVTLAAAAALKANSWQSRLDKATLGLGVPPRQRIKLVQRALKDPALREDVQQAIDTIRTDGMGKGHPKVIDLLWPTGTSARSDIESLFALRKQVPELIEEVLTSPTNPLPDITPAVPDTAELQAQLSGLVSLVTDSEKQKELKQELSDLARKTPKGLETPDYSVVRTLDGPLFLGKPEPVEVRKYAEFTVARTSTGAAGLGVSAGSTGFNTLASYLFGKNAEDKAMAMTMPVEMTAGGTEEGTMSFVLPKQDAEAPPAPLEGSAVTIATVPERLVAVKAFGGIVTEAEVNRQKGALLEVIANDATLAAVDESQITLLQYNSPLTIPWRRRNEVAIVVTEATMEDGSLEDAEEQPAVEVPPSAVGVVSWYDSGLRL